jgi:glycosyltransferase involved in cell wall biosynthesis
VTLLYFADTRFPIERANGVQTMETCHALAARGHRVTLVTRQDSSRLPRDPLIFYGLPALPGLSFRVVKARGGPRRRRLTFLISAIAMAVRHRRDAIAFTRDLGLAASLLQLPKSRRPRVVYESHGLSVTVAQEMPALLGRPGTAPSAGKLARLDRRERLVWQRAAAYVTITRALADELRARYGDRHGVLVAPDAARPLQVVPIPEAKRFIAGYAGHLYPWKGVDVFVQALAEAPGVHGLVVGGHPQEGDLGRVQRLVADLEIGDRVRITGLVPPGDVMDTLSQASVLVLPNTPSVISDRYTSPLKLFEYLQLQRPIVASDLAAVREVLADGTSALLVPPGDSHALARALLRLRDDAALRQRLSEGARAIAPRFTWAARAQRIEEALTTAENP